DNQLTRLFKETNALLSRDFPGYDMVLMEKDTEHSPQLLTNIKQCGITVLEDFNCLVLPLVANNRCFGLLKILLRDEVKTTIACNRYLLNSVLILVSQLYGNEEFENTAKRLALATEGSRTKEYYNAFAHAILKSVNCYSCIIRIADDDNKKLQIV